MIFNFSGAFWNNLRSYRNSQAFDELLSKPEVTLEQVLDDEDVVQEMKNQNPKLIALYPLPSFTSARLQDLLGLLVVEPPEDADYRRGHKHPFLAAELIGCEAPQVLQSILEDPSLLSLCFSLLSSASLNLTLAGYFSKLFHILTSKHFPRILEALCAEEHIVLSRLLTHIGAKSVADCVLRVLTYEEGEAYVAERREIVERLVDLAGEGGNQGINAVSILSDCMQKSGELRAWKDIFSGLLSPITLVKLLQNLSKEASSAVRCSLTLLTILLSHPLFSELIGEGLPQLQETLEASIPTLESLMEKGDVVETSVGSMRSVGETRLLCVEMIWGVYRADLKGLEGVIGRSRLPALTTGLFFEYVWNSFLHQTYLQLIHSVLICSETEFKGQFLRNSGIIALLLEWKTEITLETGKTLRSGYMGHAIRIGQALARAFEASPDLRTAAELSPSWDSFVSDVLNPILELETRSYGGSKPTDTLEDDSDEHMDIKEEVCSHVEVLLFPSLHRQKGTR
jgi:hypothetical protein